MSEPSIDQMNEAIARFMGGNDENQWAAGMFLKYHKSWDALMPVVIKIKYDENIRLLLPSNGIEKSVWPHIQATQFMNRRLIRADIIGTHQGVYQFITWYNQQTTTNGTP